MIKIVGVRFRSAGKVYYFDPKDLEVRMGDHVIAETSKGPEYGVISTNMKMVDEELVQQPLRSLVRRATPEDEERIDSLRVKEKEALRVCREKVHEHELEMKMVDAEYSFDGSKILFYFTADGRVDFRSLVKDLAGVFHVRIELRQIGVRDETRMLGGIGICGRELCCATYLRDFQPVSIKMAKEQNLSLNPTKISGTCGRLMCCLKNEEATYEFLNARMPKMGEEAITADGRSGKVIELDVLRQRVRVLFEEEDTKEIEIFPVESLTFRPKKKKDPAQQGKKSRSEKGASAEKEGAGKQESGAHAEKRDKAGRGEKTPRGEKPERAELEARGEKSERIEEEAKGEKPERTEEEARGEKPERTEEETKGGKPERTEEEAGGEKPERTEEEAGGGKPGRTEEETGGGKPGRIEEEAGGGKPERTEKEAKGEQAEWPEKRRPRRRRNNRSGGGHNGKDGSGKSGKETGAGSSGKPHTERGPASYGKPHTERGPAPSGKPHTERGPAPSGKPHTERGPAPSGKIHTERGSAPSGKTRSENGAASSGKERPQGTGSPAGTHEKSVQKKHRRYRPRPKSPSGTKEQS